MRRPSRHPAITAKAPIRNDVKKACERKLVGVPAPIPTARLSMDRAMPNVSASIGDTRSSLFLLASSASLCFERSKSFTSPSTKSSKKLNCCVSLSGIKLLTTLPTKREKIKVKLDTPVTINTETKGTFILLTP